jgi:hypothetical protein
MIGVTIIIGITISLYGNYISIMPTLIANSISARSTLTFYNFTSPFISRYLTFLRFRYSGIGSFRVQG